jgi:hypothetical protein
MAGNRVTIQLTQAQTDRVLRDADSDGLLGLIGEMEAIAGAKEAEFLASLAQLGDPRFSRSLLRGLTVLASFPGRWGRADSGGCGR